MADDKGKDKPGEEPTKEQIAEAKEKLKEGIQRQLGNGQATKGKGKGK